MSFRIIHANYDKKTRRAYVELRQDDADGDEMIVAAIFSYRRTSIFITKRAFRTGSRDEGASPYEEGRCRAG